MPAAYESIRESLIKRCMDETGKPRSECLEAAKESASKIYISQGKTSADRSGRAKSLHKG